MAITLQSTSTNTGNSATASGTAPGTRDVGDVIIALIGCDDAATIATPAGYNSIFNVANGSTVRLAAFWREATDDTNDNVSSSLGSSQAWTVTMWAFAGATDPSTTPPEASTGATGTGTTPDPDSLTPSWGATGETAYMAICQADHGNNPINATTGMPSGYVTPGAVPSVGGGQGTVHGSTYRLVTGSPENPGTFTRNRSEQWVAGTLALEEASTAVNIPVPVGALAFAGQTPSLDFELHPGAGGLVLAGLTPVCAVTVLKAMPAGSLTFAGQAPTLDFELHPGVGALVLAGQTPGMGFELHPAAGTLVLDGLAPQRLIDDPTPVPVGTLTFAGQTPIRRATETIAVPVGTLVLAGQAPTPGHGIPVPAGTLTFAGLAPELYLGVPVPAGTLTLAGLQPATNWSVGMPAGSLVFAGQAPSMDFELHPNAGALVLQGLLYTINIVAGVEIEVPVGALVLTGQQPEAFIPQIPGAGQLVLAGQTPTIVESGNRVIGVPVGTLTFTGELEVVAIGILMPLDSATCPT